MKDILQDKLKRLSEDTLMIEAIMALINERIEKEKPEIGKTDNDKVLGEKFRAYENAKNMLNGILQDIEIYDINKTNSKEFNKSR